MELLIKASAAGLTAAAIGLIIKNRNPELSLLLSACTAALILTAALGFLSGLRELTEAVKTIAGGDQVYTAPVLKCVGIAIVTKLCSELCRDSAQSSVAAAVELAGTVCAMSVAMPLIMSMLRLIGGMV